MQEKAVPHNVSDDEALFSKIAWHVMPLLLICYVVAYIDRVNISLAKLQMLGELKLSATVYGLGAGIFFIGYLLCELPSNLIMHRVGARYWIARIMVTWGIIAAAIAFTAQFAVMSGRHNASIFLALRFLLGAAEAGFFPGLVLYANYWFPPDRQGRFFAVLMAAQPISFVIGLPISGWLLERMDKVLGISGWQWMLVLEAAPALFLGIAALFLLKNGPKEAHWLNDHEKARLNTILAKENKKRHDLPLSKVIRMRQLWTMMSFWFLSVLGVYGINFWLPSLIHDAGVSNSSYIGLFSALPYVVCAITMIFGARMAELRGRKHVVVGATTLIAGVALIAGAYWGKTGLTATLISMTIAMSGCMTAAALFWSMPGRIFSGRAVAAAIAAVNCIGNLGGFAGPSLLGLMSDRFGSVSAGLGLLGLCLCVAGVIAILTLNDSNLSKPEHGISRNRKFEMAG